MHSGNAFGQYIRRNAGVQRATKRAKQRAGAYAGPRSLRRNARKSSVEEWMNPFVSMTMGRFAPIHYAPHV